MSDISIPANTWIKLTMNNPRFTMRLDPELKQWLETEAKRQDRSAAYLAKQAIRALKEKSDAKDTMVREAIKEADKGVFISEEKVTAWFESLGTDHELAEPEPDIFLNRIS